VSHQVSDKTPNLDDLIEKGEELLRAYPDDFALKLGIDCLKAHRREIRSECRYNHWSVANSGATPYRFCPYCGLDISDFIGVDWISEKQDVEDERARRARRTGGA